MAKKIASTSAEFSPVQLGQALFGLQGLSSTASIFQDSAVGLDSDEVTFLLSTIYDKIKVLKDPSLPLSSLAMSLQGMTALKDPISMNIKSFLYNQLLKMEDANFLYQCQENLKEPVMVSRVYDPSARLYKVAAAVTKAHDEVLIDPLDVVNIYRATKLNSLEVPLWLEKRYRIIEKSHSAQPVIPFNRVEKLVSQKYGVLYSDQKFTTNTIVDGFRLEFKFDNLNLNIELDGPTHRFPSRFRFDMLRDEYLRNKIKLNVVRILMGNKSVDEIVNEIRKVTVETAEKTADLEIQKLYFKEDKIQKLYSRKK